MVVESEGADWEPIVSVDEPLVVPPVGPAELDEREVDERRDLLERLLDDDGLVDMVELAVGEEVDVVVSVGVDVVPVPVWPGCIAPALPVVPVVPPPDPVVWAMAGIATIIAPVRKRAFIIFLTPVHYLIMGQAHRRLCPRELERGQPVVKE